MVDTQEIIGSLVPVNGDLEDAKARTVDAAAHAELVKDNTLGHGWLGIAGGMDETIGHFRNAWTSVHTAVRAVEDARIPLEQVKDQPTPAFPPMPAYPVK